MTLVPGLFPYPCTRALHSPYEYYYYPFAALVPVAILLLDEKRYCWCL